MPSDYGNDKAMNSLKKQSRIAAALYFLNGLPAPFALLYMPVCSSCGENISTKATLKQSRNQFGTITRDDQRGEN